MRKLVKALVKKVEVYRRRSSCRQILMSMSSRELDDIGLCRGDIENVVNGRFTRS